MDRTAARFLGSGASLLGTLVQIAVISETIPDFTHLPPCLHCHDFNWVDLPGWTPLIENIGADDWRSEVTRCPGPQSAGTTFRLDSAPLPPAFRPIRYGDPVLACVKVDKTGSVKAVKLVSGTGEASLDRRLLLTIGRQWRFAPMSEVSARPGWQRVRLSDHPLSPQEMSEPAPSAS